MIEEHDYSDIRGSLDEIYPEDDTAGELSIPVLPGSFASGVVECFNFMEMEIPEKRAFLHPWIKEQTIVLISGWRGTGKSWFILSALDAITKGKPFGPWEVLEPAPCLFIDGEMVAKDIQERLRSLFPPDEVRLADFFIYSESHAGSLGIRRANLRIKEWRDDVKKYVLDNGVKIVAFDNISSLAPGMDENVKKEWDEINQWLLELRFCGVTPILAHHAGKGGSQRGTSGREDNIDISIQLVPPDDYSAEEGARFVTKFTKSRVARADLPFIQDWEFKLITEDNYVTWAYASSQAGNRLAILQMLGSKISPYEIAKQLGVGKSTVYNVRGKAIDEGYLTPSGKLTELGLTVVSEKG